MKRKIFGVFSLICAVLILIYNAVDWRMTIHYIGVSGRPQHIILIVVGILALVGGFLILKGKSLWWAIAGPIGFVIIIFNYLVISAIVGVGGF